MKKGDVIWHILRQKEYTVISVDKEKNLVVTDGMLFLYYEHCQVIKKGDDNDGKGQDKQRSNKSPRKK